MIIPTKAPTGMILKRWTMVERGKGFGNRYWQREVLKNKVSGQQPATLTCGRSTVSRFRTVPNMVTNRTFGESHIRMLRPNVVISFMTNGTIFRCC